MFALPENKFCAFWKKHLVPGTGFIGITLIVTLLAIELCITPGCLQYQAPESAGNQTLTLPFGSWQLTGSSAAQKPILHIMQDGSISGFTGVNTFQGRLNGNLAAGEFRVDPALAVTLRMGPDMDQERKFLEILHRADRWQIARSGRLKLYSGDVLLAVFAPSDSHKQDAGKLITE